MNATLLSRYFLSTSPYVLRKNTPELSEKAGKDLVYQHVALNFKAAFGKAYLCGKVLVLAAANSLSLYYLPATVDHDNNCGCL